MCVETEGDREITSREASIHTVVLGGRQCVGTTTVSPRWVTVWVGPDLSILQWNKVTNFLRRGVDKSPVSFVTRGLPVVSISHSLDLNSGPGVSGTDCTCVLRKGRNGRCGSFTVDPARSLQSSSRNLSDSQDMGTRQRIRGSDTNTDILPTLSSCRLLHGSWDVMDWTPFEGHYYYCHNNFVYGLDVRPRGEEMGDVTHPNNVKCLLL